MIILRYFMFGLSNFVYFFSGGNDTKDGKDKPKTGGPKDKYKGWLS